MDSDAGGKSALERGVRRLADDAVEATRRTTPERIACTVFVAYSDRKAGWCVFQSYAGTLQCETLAGPFATREAAEAMLGPAAPKALPGA